MRLPVLPQAEYDERDDLKSFIPSSLLIGYGKMDGRDVCLMANDFTIKGGSSDENAMYKQEFIVRMAQQRLMPLICLYEGLLFYLFEIAQTSSQFVLSYLQGIAVSFRRLFP